MIGKLLLLALVATAAWAGAHSCSSVPTPPSATAQTPVPLEAGPARDWRASYRIAMRANETTVYGTPWDSVGFGGLMLGGVFMRAPLSSSPPDMVLCVVSATAYECHQRGTAAEPESHCHDSFDCAWTVRAPREAFGIVVIDLDGLTDQRLHDLVDVAIVGTPGRDHAKLEAAIRALLPRLSSTDIEAPQWLAAGQSLTVFPGEKKRRSRDIPVVDPAACADKPCKLIQAEVAIKRE